MSRGIVLLASLMFLIAFIGLAEEQGLLLYLPFDEGSGKVAKDISGNGNDGQIIDAEWVDGKFGKALSFNGKTAYVEVPYNDDFNINDEITLAAWIKIDHLPLNPAYRGIINAKKSNYGPYLLQTSTLNGLSLYEFSMYLGGAWSWNVSTTEESTDWVHLVGVYDGKISIIYVDGKLDVEKTLGGKIDSNTDEGVVIGHFYGLADRWFHGLIDEVAIYKRAISADEVVTLYKGAADLKAVSPKSKLAVAWGELKIRH